jgi:hypothetical protein
LWSLKTTVGAFVIALVIPCIAINSERYVVVVVIGFAHQGMWDGWKEGKP